MDRKIFIEGLQAFERQITELIERIDATREKLLPLTETKAANDGSVTALASVLHNDIMQLRELCQKFVLSNALFIQSETGG